MSTKLGFNSFIFANPEILWDVEELKKNQIRYVIVIPESRSNSEQLNLLRLSAKLIKTWEPRTHQPSELEKFDSQIITGGPFTWKDLWSRTANGYQIELYDLDADAVAVR